jgi:dihydropteroate synthase
MVTQPHRASAWKLRTRTLSCGTLPWLMGIVNVTPDSFSDGGQWYDTGRAIEHGLRLAEQGADILDIGGESTRPYSTPVDPDEEQRRILPVVRELCRQTRLPISIDTSKAHVARAALDAGAEIINDVTGLTGDPAMVPLALQTEAAVCVMHMQGTPQTMQDQPTYQNVVTEVRAYLEQRRHALIQQGIDPARICLDPGIGFGKTHQHNLTLLAATQAFVSLGQPVLIGHSRKGFIGKVIGDPQADRTAGNIGVSLAVACQGAHCIRVHDVQPVRHALLLFAAAGGCASHNS